MCALLIDCPCHFFLLPSFFLLSTAKGRAHAPQFRAEQNRAPCCLCLYLAVPVHPSAGRRQRSGASHQSALRPPPPLRRLCAGDAAHVVLSKKELAWRETLARYGLMPPGLRGGGSVPYFWVVAGWLAAS
ncbi:hypothetical protein BKA80DRAFT_51185 [Phyllosticta citrichinensis]